MASDHIRASDQDRDAVVAALRDAFAEGRLTLEEFQERSTVAYAGRTWGDLRELMGDLPATATLGGDLPPGALESIGGPQPSAPQPAFPAPGASQPRPPQLAGDQDPQPMLDDMPPQRPHPGRAFTPVLPVLGMWMLFAFATRSAGGALVFVIAIVVLMVLTSIGRRRPPRDPGNRQ